MTDLSFNIGSVRLENPLIMAPMAGITNLPFRLIVRASGAAMTVTEMVSAVGLYQHGHKTLKLMTGHEADRPFCVQLFGQDPETLAVAASMAEEAGADIINVNMGCPAKKIVKNGSGAALLKDFKRIDAILKAMKARLRIPLTIKTRSGWRPGEGEVLDLVPILKEHGLDAVILHPRHASQGFSGKSDWTEIARLVDAFPGVVIGNGDIFQPAQVPAMMQETACSGVMIGRGAMGNPWLFGQALALLNGREIDQPGLKERFGLAVEHALKLREHVGAPSAVYMLRSVLMWYTKGLPDSGAFRQSINRIKDFDVLMDGMKGYFDRIDPAVQSGA